MAHVFICNKRACLSYCTQRMCALYNVCDHFIQYRIERFKHRRNSRPKESMRYLYHPQKIGFSFQFSLIHQKKVQSTVHFTFLFWFNFGMCCVFSVSIKWKLKKQQANEWNWKTTRRNKISNCILVWFKVDVMLVSMFSHLLFSLQHAFAFCYCMCCCLCCCCCCLCVRLFSMPSLNRACGR